MTHLELERTFHPVGQGAFFTECFESDRGDTFNVVYDCGTNSPKKILENAVLQAFAQGVPVDVVFVSHLDKDHINGIKYLADNKNLTPRTLFVMPLFSKEVYILSYLKYGASFIQMFRAISQMGCYVLFVKPAKIEEGRQDVASIDLRENTLREDSQTIMSISGIPIKGTVVQSGTKLALLDIWEYVPFNPSGADADLFQKELAQQRIQIDLVLNALGRTRPTDADKIELEKIKKIYGKVISRIRKDTNKLNISSLVLLSHKASDAIEVNTCYWCRPYYHYWNCTKSACLYTGDSDLSTASTYRQLMNDVMQYQRGESLQFLQIPHHGSKNNYCLALCRGFSYDVAFTNYGVNYHQKIFDSQLIMEYLKQGRPLVLITAYPQTRVKIRYRI